MKKRSLQPAINKKQKKMRMILIAVFFVVGFGGIVYRCLYLHLAHDPKLSRMAKTQYRTKVAETPPRGNIYEASGEELAISVPNYSLAARPQKIKDRKKLVSQLSQVLGKKPSEIESVLNISKKYVWVKRNLSPQEKDKLSQTPLDGLELVKGSKRFYPNREVASQILGAVGTDYEGLSGVELLYDPYLQGSIADDMVYRDARGKVYETEETMKKEVQEPHHLYLTLRKNIQYVAEKEITETCQKYKAKACTTIVMDPKTAQILAMASYPTFNPNAYQKFSFGSWRNLAVTDSFEPGSTFKTILMASALENGMVTPNEKFFCENGDLRIGKHVIHDHEKYGMLSVRDILKVSSNIGVYKIGKKIGKSTFAETISLFGFGKKTGIDYPGEGSGFIRSPKKWQEIDFANISFGQGVTVTPLQLASAFSTIANGGERLRPYLVSRITDLEGKPVKEFSPQVESQVLSAETSRTLIEMMKEVAREGGTAVKAALPGYTVAGKTGTAQKVINGRYSHTQFMSSFIGMVPADDPKLVVLVLVDEPKGETYGGLVAAPVFRNIAWASLIDLGVPTEAPVKSNEPVVAEKLTKVKVHKIEASFLETSVPPVASVSKGSVPDFRGLSKRSVLALMDQSGVNCQMVGAGIAAVQEPAPGSSFSGKCRVFFKAQ